MDPKMNMDLVRALTYVQERATKLEIGVSDACGWCVFSPRVREPHLWLSLKRPNLGPGVDRLLPFQARARSKISDVVDLKKTIHSSDGACLLKNAELAICAQCYVRWRRLLYPRGSGLACLARNNPAAIRAARPDDQSQGLLCKELDPGP